ncbi:promoting complex subunit 11 [Seminavis robusta]|uniref:Anaphase-promoting complex subunit 11 n=1 Tax=Seminavis robusta TaxID=568900 RepID=A0A9N8DBH1_9STRA|nr:promoting complex subunit 11 [Seminavis robusta]|eukprot:Sro65_g036950.1 promoting complex subunit 11 (135) ;mRNA; f:121748-122393
MSTISTSSATAGRKRRSDTAVVTSSSATTAAGIPTSSNSKGSKLTVRIKRHHAVAQWVWGNHDPNEVCGICQSAYEGVAPGGRWPGEDCPVVWGKCSHSFHLQCVVTWLNGPTARGTCPICRQEWALEESPSGN